MHPTVRPSPDTSWEFYNPVRIVFGVGALDRLVDLVAGRRTLLLTTPGFTRRGLTQRIEQLLHHGIVKTMDTVQPNPDLDDLEMKANSLASERMEVIVAVGGGSVIDTGKVLGAMIGDRTGDFSLREHLESENGDFTGRGVPVIAVPTTAGTGSEVTPFATVWDAEAKRKYSLTGPHVFPEAALLDPLLSVSLPLKTTIVTGLDAISQAFEAIWNRNATPLTTFYATKALKLALPALPKVKEDLGNIALRSLMTEASLLAGLAISHTRTALAHSISYPLTMHYGMPHGLACSFTLPAVLSFNAEVDDGRLQRLATELGLTGVKDLCKELEDFMNAVEVKAMLGEFMATGSELLALVPEMYTPGRADNNMRPVKIRDLNHILSRYVR